MTSPNIGQLVAQIWEDVSTKIQPYVYVIFEMKDGRRFIDQQHYTPKTFMQQAEYKSGRIKTGHWELSGVMDIGSERLLVYRQPKLRSEPRFDVAPEWWTPFDPSAPLPAKKPPFDPNDVFTSSIFAELLKEKTS